MELLSPRAVRIGLLMIGLCLALAASAQQDTTATKVGAVDGAAALESGVGVLALLTVATGVGAPSAGARNANAETKLVAPMAMLPILLASPEPASSYT